MNFSFLRFHLGGGAGGGGGADYGPIIIPRHNFAERVSLARKRGLVKKMGVNWAIAVAGGWCGWECGHSWAGAAAGGGAATRLVWRHQLMR